MTESEGMMVMKRSAISSKGAAVFLIVAVLLGIGAFAGPEASANRVTLRVAHFLPPMHFYHADVLQSFISEVEELTEGRVTFQVFPASALGSPESHYDMAATGVADITISLQSYTPGKFPLSSVVELPFISDSAMMGTEILHELYHMFPEIQREYAQTKVLWLFQNDAEYVLTAKRPVDSLDDMRGLRIRTASDITSAAVRAWGGTPMFMPMPDVYDAAQRGVIDGATGPLSVMESFRLGDVLRHVTEGPFTITNFFVVMNKQAWERLSPRNQAVIEELQEKYRKLSAAKYDEAGERGRRVAEQAGVQFHKLSDAERERFHQALEGTYREWINEMNRLGLPGEAVLREAQRLSQEYRNR